MESGFFKSHIQIVLHCMNKHNWWGCGRWPETYLMSKEIWNMSKTFLQSGDKVYYYRLGMKEWLMCSLTWNRCCFQGETIWCRQMSLGVRVGSQVPVPALPLIASPCLCHLTFPGFSFHNSKIKLWYPLTAKLHSFSNPGAILIGSKVNTDQRTWDFNAWIPTKTHCHALSQ